MKINRRFYFFSINPAIFRQILYFFDHLFILEKIHNLSIFSLITFCFCFGGWCREAALCKIGFWSLYEIYSISEGTLSINQHFFTLWKSALSLKSMSLLVISEKAITNCILCVKNWLHSTNKRIKCVSSNFSLFLLRPYIPHLL